METSYDDQLAKVVGMIRQLASELLARPDRNEEAVLKEYLRRMDEYKQELLNLKIKYFLGGGLYE